MHASSFLLSLPRRRVRAASTMVADVEVDAHMQDACQLCFFAPLRGEWYIALYRAHSIRKRWRCCAGRDYVPHAPAALRGQSWRLGAPAGAQAASSTSRWRSARRRERFTSALRAPTSELNVSGKTTSHGQSTMMAIQSTSEQPNK